MSYNWDLTFEGVRGSLGLCPQHDILFDELTVEEHLDFFCKLKGYPSHLVRAETDRMVKALQLENKRKAMSSTLSGGMKRKLSVGIALCGESKVRCNPLPLEMREILSQSINRSSCWTSRLPVWIHPPVDPLGISFSLKKSAGPFC